MSDVVPLGPSKNPPDFIFRGQVEQAMGKKIEDLERREALAAMKWLDTQLATISKHLVESIKVGVETLTRQAQMLEVMKNMHQQYLVRTFRVAKYALGIGVVIGIMLGALLAHVV